MMVAEFVTRGQSGSPINGEIPCLNSTMPGSQGRDTTQNTSTGFMGQDVVLGPVSPGSASADSFPSTGSNFELAAHIKRKELFSQRKQREFIPDNKKDDNYWDRRRRNNEAAKRSREKRRFNDMVLERRVVELTKENHVLKAQLEAIKEEYGICGESIVCVEKIMATLPTSEQVLSITKRPKLSTGGSSALLFQRSPSPIPTPVIHQPVSHSAIGSPPPPVTHGLHFHHPHTTETYQHSHPLPHHETNSYHRGPPYYQPFSSQYEHPSPVVVSNNNNNALNLCSRSRARSRSHSSSRVHSPFEVSSGNGSGDESCVPLALATTQISTPTAQDSNNSLPLKLRHKSHLGDKDAASALLSLQNIKQEPGPRASPPWDEGSSDERDSGISLGSEWPGSTAATAAAAAAAAIALHKQTHHGDVDSENKHRLHSEIVRLSTEVANLKSLVIRNKAAVKQSPSQQ